MCSSFQVFAEQREEHRVLPFPMAQIRAALHALAHEPDSLGMPDRTIVEAVAGELEAVVAEVEEQVPLELPRSLVGDATPTERRMHGEAAEVRDPIRLAQLVEGHRPGALAVDLDDHAARLPGLGQRAIDFCA